ncbi:MAG: hypothetical protein ACK55I_40755, partial [bacterium]
LSIVVFLLRSIENNLFNLDRHKLQLFLLIFEIDGFINFTGLNALVSDLLLLQVVSFAFLVPARPI